MARSPGYSGEHVVELDAAPLEDVVKRSSKFAAWVTSSLLNWPVLYKFADVIPYSFQAYTYVLAGIIHFGSFVVYFVFPYTQEAANNLTDPAKILEMIDDQCRICS